MSIKTVTFGCRLNACESAAIQGFDTVENDILAVNSCAVTGEAERQCRQEIRKLRRENPDAFLVVTGCAAQLFPEKYAAMPEVDKVLGNREKLYPENYARDGVKILTSPVTAVHADTFALPVSFDGRNRAFMQIQQGCDHACTFCIVQKARGNSVSLPPDAIVAQTKKLVDSGYPELSLTGVDITSYIGFAALVKRLLNEVKNLKRLRLGSLDPAAVSNELVSLFADSDILQPHVHFSAQSGDDMILKRMARRHLRDDVIRLCDAFRSKRPDIVFGADFITGFPTETDAMFDNTVQLVQKCDITHLHVFPYSERTGTPAAKMPQIPVPVRKQRAKALRDAGDRILQDYMQRRLGSAAVVLCENDEKGLCEHYLNVKIVGGCKTGHFVPVTLTRILDKGLFEGTPAK